jgi:hypothetical protein
VWGNEHAHERRRGAAARRLVGPQRAALRISSAHIRRGRGHRSGRIPKAFHGDAVLSRGTRTFGMWSGGLRSDVRSCTRRQPNRAAVPGPCSYPRRVIASPGRPSGPARHLEEARNQLRYHPRRVTPPGHVRPEGVHLNIWAGRMCWTSEEHTRRDEGQLADRLQPTSPPPRGLIRTIVSAGSQRHPMARNLPRVGDLLPVGEPRRRRPPGRCCSGCGCSPPMVSHKVRAALVLVLVLPLSYIPLLGLPGMHSAGGAKRCTT